MSGRISDIVIHPKRRATLVRRRRVGRRVEDRERRHDVDADLRRQASYSIGCITLDPSNPDTVWVGTGENVSGRHVGLRRRRLQEPERRQDLDEHGAASRPSTSPASSSIRATRRSCTSPRKGRSGRRAASAASTSRSTAARRGRSSLEISKDTGVTSRRDRPVEPGHPLRGRVSAPAHRGGVHGRRPGIGHLQERRRGQDLAQAHGGPARRATWGRSASPSRPSTRASSTPRSRRRPTSAASTAPPNRGESFEKRNSFISGGTGPHYYQEIFADPNAFDRVYQMNPGLMVTDDGGKTFGAWTRRTSTATTTRWRSCRATPTTS